MTQPNRPYHNEPISIIEDLDPEPERGRGPGVRLDLLLGVPLLLIVVLFAVGQWWHQDYIASQYRAGQEAAGRNDWDAAQRSFTEASGYNDADALARSAQQKINDRNRLYDAVVANFDKGNWLLALRDIRQIARIQPEYRDLSAREQATLDQIYGGVLSGTVSLRTAANPSGLYFRTLRNWVYLQGSDSYSALRIDPAGGKIIYDAPDEGWTPPEEGRAPFSPNLRGRHLVYAHRGVSETFQYVQLSIVPDYYTGLIGGSAGVWAMHYFDYAPVTPVVRQSLGDVQLAYQPYSNTISTTIGYAPTASGAPRVVLAVSPTSNLYLVADWANARSFGAAEDTVVNVSLGIASKSDTQLIYTQKSGGIVSGQLSPDGRYAMIHTFSVPNASYKERQAILLIGLQNPSAPPIILRDVLTSHDDFGHPQDWMGAAFIQDGPLAGDIALQEFMGTYTQLEVIDPHRIDPSTGQSSVIAQAQVNDSRIKPWYIDYDSGELLFFGHEYINTGLPVTNTLSLASVAPGETMKVQNITIPTNSYILSLKAASDLISWTTYKYEIVSNNADPVEAMSVYNVERGQAGESEVAPTLSYSQTYSSISKDPTDIPGIALGKGLFAYTYDGSLHLRSYDSFYDLVLESGVQNISAATRNVYNWDVLR